MTTEHKPPTEAELRAMLARFSRTVWTSYGVKRKNPSQRAMLLFVVFDLPRLVDADMRLRALLGCVPYS